MQPQIGIGGVGRRRVEVDLDQHGLGPDAALLVGGLSGDQVFRRGSGRRVAELRVGEPGVEHLTGGMHGGQPPAPG